MKKLFLGLSLAVSLVAAPVFADFKHFYDEELAEMGVTKDYCEAFEHSVTLLDKALEVELSEIAEQLKEETFSSVEAKLVRISEFVKPKMDALVTKMVQVIKHDMTVQEREIVTAFLRDLKEASAITSLDLSTMLEGLAKYGTDDDNDGFSESLERATKKYCSKDLVERIANRRELSFEQSIAVFRDFEQVDLHDVTLNTAKKFLCTSAIPSRDFNLIQFFDRNLLLQQWLYLAGSSIAIAYLGFSDGYFQFVWADEVRKTGIIFEIMHPICTQLLEALK